MISGVQFLFIFILIIQLGMLQNPILKLVWDGEEIAGLSKSEDSAYRIILSKTFHPLFFHISLVSCSI